MSVPVPVPVSVSVSRHRHRHMQHRHTGLTPLALLLLLPCMLPLAGATYDGVSFKGSLESPLAQAACYRLFSREGDVGCRTPSSGGSSGALFEIGSYGDVAAARGLDMDLAYIVPAALLNSNSSLLAALHRPQGVILVEDYLDIDTDTDTDIDTEAGSGSGSGSGVSPDVRSPQGRGTPQRDLTLFPDTAWNLQGSGMAYESFRLPIVRADPFENHFLRSYAAENRRYGYRSTRVNHVDFSFYMGRGGLTSRDCLEWRDIYGQRSPQCVPLGGQSVWGTAGHLDTRRKVLGTVGMDSTALFHDLAFGANDAAATVAAFLGAAEAIGRYPHAELEHQILLFAANAEEWGYAGSRRFAKDLSSFTCANPVPVTRSHASGLPMCADPVYPSTLFERILNGHANASSSTAAADMLKGGVALDQIGSVLQATPGGGTALWVHALDPASGTAADIRAAAASVPGVELTSLEQASLPPSPLSAFTRTFAGLGAESAVIAGYGAAFQDPRYHSHYDNATYVSEDAVIRYVCLCMCCIPYLISVYTCISYVHSPF
jgi:hypothetical protein